jgi:multidrug efflux pump subunit AcrA (membrane-fusion protein)
MPFNPFAKYNVADPYGTSPSQRLSTALTGLSMQEKGIRRQDQRGRFDLAKAYKKRTPQIEANFARRGLQDSGMRNLALAEAGAGFERQRTEQQSQLESALFNLAAERMGLYGGYAGSRFEDALGATSSRAETAARIREAMA